MSPHKRQRRLAELQRIDRWFAERVAWLERSPSRREMYWSLLTLLMVAVIIRRLV